MEYTALIEDLRYGGYDRGGEIADVIESLSAELAAAKERERTNDILLEQQGDKLASLNDELAAAREEIERLHFSWSGCSQQLKDACQDLDEAEKQLAARDLVISKMRAVLVEMSRQCVSDWPALREALALQPTTEALDAYVQRAVEQEIENRAALLDKRYEECLEPEIKEAAAAIRGRGK